MLIALALTLLLALSVLRHIMEPTCPGCAAKRWAVEGEALSCRQCGWTSVVGSQTTSAGELVGAQVSGASYASAQYEISFH